VADGQAGDLCGVEHPGIEADAGVAAVVAAAVSEHDAAAGAAVQEVEDAVAPDRVSGAASMLTALRV
jgi:hypothetical protein